ALSLAGGLLTVALAALGLSLVLLAFAPLRSLLALRRLPSSLLFLTLAALTLLRLPGGLIFVTLATLHLIFLPLLRLTLSLVSGGATLRARALCAWACRAA